MTLRRAILDAIAVISCCQTHDDPLLQSHVEDALRALRRLYEMISE